jgi:murein DD-endopeptidase MepM/ murein hydrolase activator NlpD
VRDLAKTTTAILAAALCLTATGSQASSALRVTIEQAPPATSGPAAATFVWRANETAAFTCSLDGARATACTSPKTYEGLAEGPHVFLVAATNSDRAGTYTARDTHRWTIVQRGGPLPPPPPPPPTESATLLVTVTGGGSLSSTPAGIACPADCEHSFPAGTVVTLTPHAGAGYSFAGWAGGCAGSGACAVTLSGPALVDAAFVSTARPPRLYRGDDDGDGTPDASDACPESSRGGTRRMRGCSPADLLRGPAGLLGPLDDAGAGAYGRLRKVKALSGIGRDFGRARGLLARGTLELKHGDPCTGAALIGDGAALLKTTSGKSAKLVASLQSALAKQSAGIGDATAKDLTAAGLHHRHGLLVSFEGDVAALADALGHACGKERAPTTFRGRIAKTDDAGRTIELADGRTVKLAASDLELWEGARVEVSGRRLPGGTWLGESVTTLDKPLATLDLAPCVSLRIAPVQDFLGPPPVLHHPKGYLFADVLRLETGMRFGISPKCSHARPGRYSLKIVMSGDGTVVTVAADLDAGDAPVEVPIPGGATLWSIRVYERFQGSNCPPPSASQELRLPAALLKSFPCPVQTLSKTEYKAKVLQRGVYARASYTKTIVPLDSSAPQLTEVEALYPTHFTIPTGWSFEAQGYKPGGLPGPLTTVKLNETFALWPDEFYGAPLLFPLATIGVDHFAGLLWPRIVGQRNGRPFRYAVTLPTIVKDLLPGCTNARCFYRLPWKVGTLDVTSQGNGPGFSHNGNQQFAFDFSMDDGETIYATRGGVVGDLVESNAKNFNPCADNNGNGVEGDDEDKKADGPANFVRIDHADGTYSYYAHVRMNSVVPAKGDLVARGTAIAKTGNTGRSCGPHLHYQVAIDPTNTIYGATTQICFAGWLYVPPVLTQHLCYIPDDGDRMFSTNG